MSGARGLPTPITPAPLVPLLDPAPRGQESWAVVARLMRERRSNLRVDPQRPVQRELVDALIELACWAPNHKHTHPWRFCVVSGAGRERLGRVAADALVRQGRGDPNLPDVMRAKYLRAPVLLVVGSAAHADPLLHAENRDAVAAGIQNLLLSATALGLASFWASPPAPHDAPLKRLVGLGPEDQLVAFVYLGWPIAESPPARREAPVVTTLDG